MQRERHLWAWVPFSTVRAMAALTTNRLTLCLDISSSACRANVGTASSIAANATSCAGTYSCPRNWVARGNFFMIPDSTPAPIGIPDPQDAAESAGLVYVSDEEPGIRRKKAGGGFSYVTLQGSKVRDERTIKRIRKLAIPPAWTDVWVCAKSAGHLPGNGTRCPGQKAVSLPCLVSRTAREHEIRAHGGVCKEPAGDPPNAGPAHGT